MTSRPLIILSAILIYFCCLFVRPLFSLATLDPKSVQKIRVNTMSGAEYFGSSISSSDDTVIIGSPGGNKAFSFAYVFTRDDNFCWHQQATLAPADPLVYDFFGNDVSLSDETVAVGADRDVYIFVRSGTSWSQQEKIIFNHWIYNVSLSSDTLAVYAEAVYIFVRSGTSWNQQENLNIPEGYVSLSGDTLAVANNANNAVYIFVRSGTSWSQQAKLSIPASNGNVSLSGDTVAVGTDNAVYIFVRSGTSWSQQAKLIIPDTRWIRDLSLSGDTVAVDAGDAVYIFVRSGTSWGQQTKLPVHSKRYISSISTSEKAVFSTGDEYPLSIEDFLYVYSDDVCKRKNALPAIIIQLLNSNQ
ncbi:MAG: hypothetical protein D3920_11610 [Candidatus Electrothrix sp. AW2]|nr:hypothetical protein [Candidatus Electrothrix gigas]